MSDTAATPEVCANCGTPLTGEFCWNCGQRAKEPRRIVIGLVQDVIVETMSIDGKLARTIATLFLRPGRLAQEYIAGKRVKYSPPFRLYLFTSVIFFFIAFSLISQFTGVEEPPEPDTTDVAAEAAEDVEIPEFLPEALQAEIQAEIEAEMAANDGPPVVVELPEDGDNFSFGDSDGEYDDAPDWLKQILERMDAAGDRLMDDPRLFFSQARENVPRTMLMAPIIYAFMLVILYIYRRKFLIYDHLVVALYMHAALYAYLIVILVLSQFPVVGGWIWLPPFFWGVVQSYAVLRQAYGSNWFSVIIKGLLINTTYFVMLTVLISAGLGLALYNS